MLRQLLVLVIFCLLTTVGCETPPTPPPVTSPLKRADGEFMAYQVDHYVYVVNLKKNKPALEIYLSPKGEFGFEDNVIWWREPGQKSKSHRQISPNR